MKKNKSKFTQTALSILLLAPAFLQSASAQTISYSGSIGDLNAIFDPPMNIQNIICDNVSSVNVHAYRACSDGVAASRWMAEKHAKNAGKFLGCMDGFYQGIWDGYLSGMNPTAAMINEADAYVKGAKFDSATNRALGKAKAEAQTESADQIINRYRSVIGLKDNRGAPVMPNKSYQFPAIQFNGFDDGYEYDIANASQNKIDFTPVYQNGWVKPESSFEDKLAAHRSYMLQGQYAKNLCDINQTMFGRTTTPVYSIWDYFRARRNYDFQKYQWNNGNFAWTIFTQDEKTLEQYQSFSKIENLEKTITITTPIKENRLKLDATGKPIPVLKPDGTAVLNSAGQPTYQMEEVITGYKNETKVVKLDASEVQQLKNLYAQSFVTAYERYYAKQYASINYHQEGIEKYGLAKVIGQSIGNDVAEHVAKRNAYNKSYKAQSASKFAEEAKRLYKASFDRLISIFENNSVVEFQSIAISGQTEDNIFTPGEALKARFSVVNLGELSLPTTISMTSTPNMMSNLGSMKFNAPALSVSQYETPVLGNVNTNLVSGNQISVGLKITNGGNLEEVATNLIVSKNQDVTLRDYVEIASTVPSLNILEGTLGVTTTLQNPSSMLSPSISDLVIKINNTGAVSMKAIEQLPAMSKRDVAVQFQGIDPLTIINANGLNGTVESVVAGKVISRTNFVTNTNVDQDKLIVRYFDGLATGETKNSGNVSADARLGELATRINAVLSNEVSSKLKWENENEFKQTIIAEIQRVYQESVIQRTMTSQAQVKYDELANLLAKQVKHLTSRGLFNDKKNKKAFLRELSVFSKSLSTNPKDY
jgi:hypothetical protein